MFGKFGPFLPNIGKLRELRGKMPHLHIFSMSAGGGFQWFSMSKTL
jgi:hypothetical protein